MIATLNQPVTELVAKGIALHQRGDLASAEQCYLQIMTREPRHSDALHLLGVLKGQQGDYVNGARLIDEAISLKPRMSAYHNNLGNLLAKTGDTGGAEKSYRRALRIDPHNADAHLNLGKLQFTNGEREARKSLKTAQRLSPRSVEAQMSVGRLEERDGNTQLALDCYSTAAKLSPSYAPAFIASGNAQLLLGKADEAEQSYRTAIRVDEYSADAHFNLANVLRKDGRTLEAIEMYREALGLSPQGASDIQNNLGLALKELGRHQEAQTALTKSVEIASDSSDGWFNLAKQSVVLGDLRTAESHLQRALSIDADHVGARLELGNLMRTDGRLEQAAFMYRRVIELSPAHAAGWNNFGATLADLELIDEAETAFRKATSLAPDFDEAFFNLGKHLSIFGDETAAVVMLHHALSLNPTNAEAFTQLGFVAQNRGHLREAAEFYRTSVELRGDSIARNNLGLVLASLGDIEGLDLLAAAVREKPEAAEQHWNFGEKLLLHKRFHEGWNEYEWRMQVDKFVDQHRPFTQPRWDGAPLDGKTILLYAEQGQGDTLQFVRYAEFVAQRGGRVILEVQRSLQRLLKDLPWVAKCIAQGDALPEFDTYAPLMSLPYIFDTNADTIPLPPSSFFAERYESSVQAKLALQVGIVWAGNKKDKRDRLRSTALEQWSEVMAIDGVEFTSLQTGEPDAQRNEQGSGFSFVGDCSDVKDFADTAAIVAGLDLVITVDTAVAHLAGTMGKPVWMLLYDPVDWRWGLQGEETPWYPTAKLFRQFNQGGWAPVLQKVASSLRTLAESHKTICTPVDVQIVEATT